MHFYEKTEAGIEPRHFVEMATKAGSRPTRISDVKKWRSEGRVVVPSVTTIMSILDKPALTAWKIDKHLEQAFRLAKAVDSIDDFMARVKTATREEMDKAPEAGTDFHGCMERFMLGEYKTLTPQEMELCYKVKDAIDDVCGKQEWTPELYLMGDGFGGCSDLVSHGWIIDYKTKQRADQWKPNKMRYPEHSRQLAAYRDALAGMGVCEPNARCANVFVCLETGDVEVSVHTEQELKDGLAVFHSCLSIWEINNNWRGGK